MNISSGVKAKLQKWMGKASSNVRDNRVGKEISEEITNHEPMRVENSSDLIPQHSRSRSSPVPMPNKEKVQRKRRKFSVSNSPTPSQKEDSERENDTNDSYLKNGNPRDLSTHSVRLHESSSVPNCVQLVRQNALNNCIKEVSFGDQTSSVGVNTTGRTDRDFFNNKNTHAGVIEMSGSRATRKHDMISRIRSKTSVDLSGENGSFDNERMGSAVSLDSIPKNVQQLSGQIQFRLQKWVERASIAAQRDRRPSEESASSTDDSVNATDSPRPRTPVSDNEHQVKKIKELELALKELVENVGVRGGSSSSYSPGSSSGNRSRQNSQRHGSDRQESGELIGTEKGGLMDTVSLAASESRSRDSSSSADSDTFLKMTDSEKIFFDNHENEEDQEDLDDVIFMKSSNPARDKSENNSPRPRERKSVNLQDVLICQTLIEAMPKQGEDESAKKMAPNDYVEKHRNETTMQSKGSEEYFSEVANSNNRSSKTVSTEGQNETGSSKSLCQNKLSSKNGTGKKTDLFRSKKRSVSSDANSLKVGPSLAIRESMRQYLNFKDADLSAFAVECVRHANKKKQTMREGDQVQQGNQGRREKMIAQKKLANAAGTQVVDAIEQKPIVVISSQDNNQQTDEANGLNDTSTTENGHSSGSPLDKETAEEIIANEISSHTVFARTAEEADWYEKEQILAAVPNRKESLERASSHPREPVSTSQRLYKFPSMPMFYIPNEKEDSENRKQKKENRKSVASFPHALHESFNTGADPFYHGDTGLKTRPARSTSSATLTLKDENGNETLAKLKSSPRPKMRRRKISAPTKSSLYNMPSSIRVDIEALI